jgi:propanediol utilization protein|tara:strand:- start:738 stop:971 length:234 start_codon:yes stop_codon:yes gene_type:complete
MESRKIKESNVNLLSQADKEQLQVLIDRLTSLKNDEPSVITEDSVRSLEFTVNDLMQMYGRHQKLLIRWLKQGYVLD